MRTFRYRSVLAYQVFGRDYQAAAPHNIHLIASPPSLLAGCRRCRRRRWPDLTLALLMGKILSEPLAGPDDPIYREPSRSIRRIGAGAGSP